MPIRIPQNHCPTRLQWDEDYPINFLFASSQAKNLKKKIEEDKMIFIIFENSHDLWLKVIPKEVELLQWRIFDTLKSKTIDHIKVWNRSASYQDLAAKKHQEIGTIVRVILLEPVHRKVIDFIVDEINSFLKAHDVAKDNWIFFKNGWTDKHIFHEGKMLDQEDDDQEEKMVTVPKEQINKNDSKTHVGFQHNDNP